MKMETNNFFKRLLALCLTLLILLPKIHMHGQRMI